MPTIAIGERLRGPGDELFKITGFLGKGGFGEVYIAVGEISGAVVAVKLLPIMSLDSDAY